MLTQKILKRLFDYDPSDKARPFVWKVSNSNRIKVGARAGSKMPSGYYSIMIDGKHYRIHRLVWLWHYGKFPDKQLDHINHDRADNRIKNLREVTNQENGRNRSKQKDNTSGHTGVYWHKGRGKWVAQITLECKIYYLGVFEDKEEAALVRRCIAYAHGFHANHGQ